MATFFQQHSVTYVNVPIENGIDTVKFLEATESMIKLFGIDVLYRHLSEREKAHSRDRLVEFNRFLSRQERYVRQCHGDLNV